MTADKQTLLDKALEIDRRLNILYGKKTPYIDGKPIAALINTILSQNTNDRNRDIAYQQLRERFPTWESVRDAQVEEIIGSIRPAGLAPSKGPCIQQALQHITTERGMLTLDFLNDLPLDEARAWLTNLRGVGPKTAAIVLLFSMGRPAFPVDTHIHRITKRWGLIPEKTSREKAHILMEDLVPSQLYYSFHINIITHGRTVCSARKPQCDLCSLQDLCLYYKHMHTGE